jgi:hypothetical protein
VITYKDNLPLMQLDEIFSRSNFFFSGYFRIPKDRTKSIFVYQNNTLETELLDAIIFPCGGIKENKHKIIHKVLSPGDLLLLDTEEISSLLGDGTEGSIFLCLKGPEFKEAVAVKDLMLNWASVAGGSTFAVGPFAEINAGPNKAKKSFFMSAPIVCSKERGVKSVNVLINHSSDPAYDDTIMLTPQLSNLNGEVIVGQPFQIPPFGMFVVDIEKYFGSDGVTLLNRTNGYGAITAQHLGHILPSYFFQTDVEGNIICGNHTQPPTGIFAGRPLPQLFKEKIKQMFPWIVYLRAKRAESAGLK